MAGSRLIDAEWPEGTTWSGAGFRAEPLPRGAALSDAEIETLSRGIRPDEEPLLRLYLPAPPSANALYKRTLNRNGRRPRTDAYAAWRTEAGWRIVEQRSFAGVPCEPIKRVRLDLGMPFSYRRDISNGIKAVEDLLKEHGVIVDDRWVEELRVRRVSVSEALEVAVWRLGA